MDEDYKKKMEIIMSGSYEKPTYRNCYTKEVMDIPDNKDYFFKESEFNKSQLETKLMAIEDKNVNELTLIEKLTSIVLENDGSTCLDLTNTDQNLSTEDPEEGKDLIKDHKKYIKDFSKKVAYGGGMFLTSHFLTSMGLPPTAVLKPLVVGGVKLTGSVLNVIAPYAAPFVVPYIPSALLYVNKEIKKIKHPKVEEPLDPSAVEPPVDSHTIWDILNLMVSVTYKVLKKIHDIF